MSGKVSSERALEIEFPDILHDLWRWFLDMHYARGSNMNGASGISYLEIQAYSQLKQIKFEDWQLTAIRHLDNLFLQSQTDK
jgi:hypothetical protein